MLSALRGRTHCCAGGARARLRARRRTPPIAPRRIASFNVCADQLVVALADPAQIVGLSPYASDPAISVVAEKARAYPRLALQAEAMVPLKPDLVLVGTWDRPLTQRMLRGLGFRVVGVDVVSDLDAARRADPRDRGAARPSRARRGADRRDRSGAAPACRGAAADVVERAADRQRRLHGRARTASPAALLAEAGLTPPPGAPAGYGGYVPLEKLIMLRPDYPGDGERRSRRRTGRARSISRIRRCARSIRRSGGSCCRAATRCARARAWSRRSTISPDVLTRLAAQ